MGIKTVTHLCKALSYTHMKEELNTEIRMLWDVQQDRSQGDRHFLPQALREGRITSLFNSCTGYR